MSSYSLYTIEEGNHYPNGFYFDMCFNYELKFKCLFNEGCLYQQSVFHDPVDFLDINKLYGFSTSYHHHDQSARFGWRANREGYIEIFAYSYVNGKRYVNESNYLGRLKPNEWGDFTLRFLDGYVDYYKFNYTEKYIEKEKRWLKIPYKLYPYFGGNNTAPHDMNICIKEIK